MICISCGKSLTNEEEHYYGSSCEACEQKWLHRINKWLLGGHDQGLDELYSEKGGLPQ